MFAPGELFVEHQLNLRARSPFEQIFFIGYATSSGDPWPGYIPTFEMSSHEAYGTTTKNVRLEEGAGEVIIDRAVLELYRLAGLIEPGIEEQP